MEENMKRRISVFLCMMTALIMTTGVVMATSNDIKEEVNSKNYDKVLEGSSSEFTAIGTGSVAYGYVENTSDYSRYLTCEMREHTVNVGNTEYRSGDLTGLKGASAYAEIPRDLTMVGYYWHSAGCYVSEYSPVIVDTHSYKE